MKKPAVTWGRTQDTSGNPGDLWLEPPVLCHWATTAGQPPALTILYMFYTILYMYLSSCHSSWQSTGCTNQVSFPVTAILFTFLYFTSKHLKLAILFGVVGCQGQYPSVELQIVADFQNCVYIHGKYIHIHITYVPYYRPVGFGVVYTNYLALWMSQCI